MLVTRKIENKLEVLKTLESNQKNL